MPTYATATDLRDWTGQTEAELPTADAERVLTLAERDIDALSPLDRALDTTTGRRFIPADLSTRDQLVLSRITCAQAEYRLVMGNEFFTRGQYQEVNGPDFTTKGRLPRVAPSVWQELAGSDLIRFGTTTGTGGYLRDRTEPDSRPRHWRDEFERG